MNDRSVLSALLREDFALFLTFVFREIGGEGEYQHNWHIDAIKFQLDRIAKGDNRRLIITMPPRHLKSTAVTIAWIAWMLGHNPALRFITVSYGIDLSEPFGRETLKIFDSWWFRAAFPELVLTRRAVLDLATSQGGGRLATSLGGALTGRGADYIVIDDPTKSKDAASEAVRESDKAWLFNTLMTRLNDQAKGAIILVMQRLHEGDLAGELISRGGWHELRLPSIAVEDQRVQIGEGRFYSRREGHPLHGARQSLTVLHGLRREMGSHNFAAQFQQEPVPAFGNLVQASWLKTYDSSFDPTKAPGTIVQSWDTASRENPYNDFSVCIIAHVHGRDIRILDMFRRKLTYPKLRHHAERLARDYKADSILIENQSSGLHLLDDLRLVRDIANPISRKPEGDKEARMGRISAMIEAGHVMLPGDAHWLPDFKKEVLGFPNAKHDDVVDALSQLGIWVIEKIARAEPESAGPILVESNGDGSYWETDEQGRRLVRRRNRPDVDPWGA